MYVRSWDMDWEVWPIYNARPRIVYKAISSTLLISLVTDLHRRILISAEARLNLQMIEPGAFLPDERIFNREVKDIPFAIDGTIIEGEGGSEIPECILQKLPERILEYPIVWDVQRRTHHPNRYHLRNGD